MNTCTSQTQRRRWYLGLGAAGLTFAVAVASLLSMHGPNATWAAGNPSAAPPPAVASANDLSAAFRYASEQVVPSVVTIHTVRDVAARSSSGQDLQGIPEEMAPLLKRFFGDDLRQFKAPQSAPRGMREEGTGSGVIIDPSGVILTNNHVAGGGGKVVVTLHDGREFTAVDVKTDPKTDIAIVRIEGAGVLPAARLGDSDQMQIGDWVLAIGSPFGLDDTVTAGIISAKSRGMGIAEREDFLQTDAAINPGNSGGPLVNLKGEVIGINTAISTRGGGSDGIGFAVPINLAKWVSAQLSDKGTVQRAFLGIGIQKVNSDLSKQFGLTTVHGALVTDVRPDSAGAKAGLKTGDVVIELDGYAVQNPRHLQNLVERAALDHPHKITVMRDGQRQTFEVHLQTMPENLTASTSSGMEPAPSEFKSLGLEVSDLTADVAKQLGLSETKGVVITSVASGSAAESAGLKAGMVISRVGTQDVTSVDQFRTAVNAANLKDGVLLLVKSAEGSRFLVLKSE